MRCGRERASERERDMAAARAISECPRARPRSLNREGKSIISDNLSVRVPLSSSSFVTTLNCLKVRNNLYQNLTGILSYFERLALMSV